MAKKKKEKCSVCHDKGAIELEHGLINQMCPEGCQASIDLAFKNQIPEFELQPRTETKSPDTGTEFDISRDNESPGSNSGKVAGDKEPEGKEDTGEVLEGDEFILPSARKEPAA